MFSGEKKNTQHKVNLSLKSPHAGSKIGITGQEVALLYHHASLSLDVRFETQSTPTAQDELSSVGINKYVGIQVI